MKFSTKLFAIFALVVLMAGSSFAEVNSPADLKSAKVGVENASAAHEIINEMLKDSHDNIFVYENVSALVEALRMKLIDAAVLDETPARYFLINYDGLKVLHEPVASFYYGIAFKKGNKLRDDVNKALTEIKDEGTLAHIIAKYINAEPDPAGIDFNKGAKGGKLWLGCSAVFPPYEVRTENGFAGIDIELCAAIAKKLDKELVVIDCRFEILPEALESGRIDMICSAFTINEERQKVMDFSDPYDADQEVILVLADKPESADKK
ncbi:MAG: transporter substrate-binding domain-containing protein [Synergistaceae bacterium]|nr:transporter substrate-binding domain-containing protein [Synergistaceae bacterium]